MSHHWFLLHIFGMKADKNIISSVPGPLGMSPPGPTRKKIGSEEILPMIRSLYLKLVDVWRLDGRCGCNFPLPDGSGPATCDFESNDPCCSEYGYCGNTDEHCSDPGIDYRKGITWLLKSTCIVTES